MTAALHTARLELRPGTAAALRAELEGRAELARALGVEVPRSWPPELYDSDAVRWTLEQLGDQEDGGQFGFHYLILRPGQPGAQESGTLIGIGGFKGPPDSDGEVELGYGVLHEYQGRGYATEAVLAWVARAFADARVSTVVGQTLASLTASIRVLERSGFQLAGAGDDPGAPEGERVIRYVLARASYERDRRDMASERASRP
jgi:ribosomal-protein-alanine N-acetyltransferase